MSETERLKKFADEIGCFTAENEPMSRHTSFKIGGLAPLFIETDEKSAVKIFEKAKEIAVPLTVIGCGTNILVSDKGVCSAVLKLNNGNGPYVTHQNEVVCSAGVKLSKLCVFAMENGLSGVEFAYGIPGSVGGAIYMNAGAYGSEIKDCIVSCRALTNGKIKTYTKDEMKLSYRKSTFSGTESLILDAVFALKSDNKDAIKNRMDKILLKRRAKQPLEYPSAGSTFKRPEGYYAAALIEECGLKGYRIGGAEVSAKHSGFVINVGGATCDDVCRLIEFVKKTVKEKKNVELEPEVIFIGN